MTLRRPAASRFWKPSGVQAAAPGGDAAAARLGMKRTTLIAHMKRLSIDAQTVIGRH